MDGIGDDHDMLEVVTMTVWNKTSVCTFNYKLYISIKISQAYLFRVSSHKTYLINSFVYSLKMMSNNIYNLLLLLDLFLGIFFWMADYGTKKTKDGRVYMYIYC